TRSARAARAILTERGGPADDAARRGVSERPRLRRVAPGWKGRLMAGPKATERRVKALERKEARRGYKSAKKAAKTLCESVERQRVIRACERATKAADEARAEYLRTLPSPEERAMQRRRRERALERRELPRRDAIARVVEVHGAPEAVAEMAVRRAERRAGSS